LLCSTPAAICWLLERASTDAWNATDVSKAIGQTFRADTGGDSILVFDNQHGIPATRVPFRRRQPDQELYSLLAWTRPASGTATNAIIR